MTNRQLDYIIKDQKPLALHADETVRKACRSMAEHNAGSVLVVDDHHRLVGIFTGRDAVRLLAKGKAGDVALSVAMTKKPVSCEPGGRAIDALCAMCEGGFRHLPVTRDGKVVGVISRRDFKGMEIEHFVFLGRGCRPGTSVHREIAKVIDEQKGYILPDGATVQDACKGMLRRKQGAAMIVDAKKRLKGIFTGRDAVRLLGKSKAPAALPIAKGMCRNPITIERAASAIEALRIMNERGFRHLPVVENEKILGIVSRNDFSGIELDQLEQEEHLKECIW